jgi:hypothetical protein
MLRPDEARYDIVDDLFNVHFVWVSFRGCGESAQRVRRARLSKSWNLSLLIQRTVRGLDARSSIVAARMGSRKGGVQIEYAGKTREITPTDEVAYALQPGRAEGCPSVFPAGLR